MRLRGTYPTPHLSLPPLLISSFSLSSIYFALEITFCTCQATGCSLPWRQSSLLPFFPHRQGHTCHLSLAPLGKPPLLQALMQRLLPLQEASEETRSEPFSQPPSSNSHGITEEGCSSHSASPGHRQAPSCRLFLSAIP